MRRAPRWLAALWLLVALPGAAAQMAVLELRHRSAETLLPLVRPLAPADTVITGRGDRLVVRGTSADIDAIRDVVRSLDTAAASLRISLRTIADSRRRGHQAGVRFGAGGGGERGARASVRVHSTRDARESERVQSVRAVAGRPARIDTGGLRLLRDRALIIGPDAAGYGERTRVVRWTDAFLATARVQGESVTVALRVAQGRDPAAEGPVRGVVTTVRGRLGEWLPVGSVSERARGDAASVVHGTREARHSNLRLELRVERLD